MKSIIAVGLLASWLTGCSGSVAGAHEGVPATPEETTTVPAVAPLETCCVPSSLCDALSACDPSLVGLCRAGIDPSGGRCGQPGFSGCSVPMSWCAPDGGGVR